MPDHAAAASLLAEAVGFEVGIQVSDTWGLQPHRRVLCVVWQFCEVQGQFAWRPGYPTSLGNLPNYFRTISLAALECWELEQVLPCQVQCYFSAWKCGRVL